MSETNLQLFPGVFRSTVGGENPGFFLHSDGRVGIGNKAPTARPLWSSDDADRNKLNVTGHTHIDGNLNVTGHLYGDGSTLSGVAAVIGGYWDLDQSNNNINYSAGNVGIGGAANTNKLKVHGTVEATAFIENGTDISSTYATSQELTDGLATKQASGSYQAAGSYATSQELTDGLASKQASGSYQAAGSYASLNGSLSTNFSSKECYVQNWVRTKGNAGHYWEPSSNGNGWHIYPKSRSDMYMRTGSGNGGICGSIQNGTARGYVHWTTSNEIGFLNSGRSWSLRMTSYATGGDCNVSGDVHCRGLHISGIAGSAFNLSDASHDYWTNGGSVIPHAGYAGHGSSHQHWAIIATYGIKCQFVAVTSDKRIKTEFEELDDSEALVTLRKLKPCKYHYKDLLRQQPEKTIGFIAQEVNEIIPGAVKKTKGVIPDLQRKGLIEIIDVETKKLKLQMTDVGYDWPEGVGLKEGDVFSGAEEPDQALIKFRVDTVVDADELIFLITCIDDFDVDALDKIKNWKHIAVIGHNVDDLHHLDKSAIFTIATSALQEVDRQLRNEKEKTKSLEDRMSILEEIISRNGLT